MAMPPACGIGLSPGWLCPYNPDMMKFTGPLDQARHRRIVG
jgi:hypothetical protein